MDFEFHARCTMPVVGRQVEEVILDQGFNTFDEMVKRLITQLAIEQG
jgi:hypothetical protein